MSEDLKGQLVLALEEIDRPGSYCVSGQEEAVPPGLEVEGLGTVALPLTAAQAKKLKGLCERAPYGKGEQTLVDPSVRKVWRLTPDKFRLTNPAWPKFLASIVKKVREELGLERQKVEAHLYDLLLYEKGSFFLPHKDGEKLDRMVATLVIVLPSSFEGGELVVRHEGEEKVLDFGGGQDPFHHHWAAFYADCEHEVRPLQAGYRLCLIYNLTLGKTRKSPGAPRFGPQEEEIARLLKEWAAGPGARRLVYTLAHEYTQEGLAWDALKGVDRPRALALLEGARQTDCEAYLAILTLHEAGEGRDLCGGNPYHRRRWYDEDEDEEEDEEGGSGFYEMGDIYETSLTAEHWVAPDGSRPKLREQTVKKEELLDPEVLKAVDPEEYFEGYTGNAGMTLDRWYRHAAVFIWPKRQSKVKAAGSRS